MVLLICIYYYCIYYYWTLWNKIWHFNIVVTEVETQGSMYLWTQCIPDGSAVDLLRNYFRSENEAMKIMLQQRQSRKTRHSASTTNSEFSPADVRIFGMSENGYRYSDNVIGEKKLDGTTTLCTCRYNTLWRKHFVRKSPMVRYVDIMLCHIKSLCFIFTIYILLIKYTIWW